MVWCIMKSQHILLLFKLISIHGTKNPRRESEIIAKTRIWRDWDNQERDPESKVMLATDAWQGKDEELLKSEHAEQDYFKSLFSVRSLAEETGISKSQISLSLNRCYEIGLAKIDRKTLLPKANKQALLEFISYGIRYVFPVKAREITRGIATSIAAPVLQGQLMTSGNLPPVWPDASGNTKGVAVEPLHPGVFTAIRHDPELYAMLALTDAIRMGQPRERKVATEKLSRLFEELK